MNEAALTTTHPVFEDTILGVGTWSWGDRIFWGYGQEYSDDDLHAAFNASLDAGLRFFDTAEVYGQGKSEELLGEFLASSSASVKISTKFMPFPWRLRRASLLNALKGSLARLQQPWIDLYQIQMPLPPVTIETWMGAMVEAVEDGLIKAVGVSNFNAQQMEKAHSFLIREGIQLASNQVEYSLLNREAEYNGLIDQGRELGVKIIAYSPLALGLLTGKYTPENPLKGMRNRRFDRDDLITIQPLIKQLKVIGMNHEGKTSAQVALNWIICKGALPIPGAKNAVQILQNAGAVGWQLEEEEVAILDELSSQIDQNSR